MQSTTFRTVRTADKEHQDGTFLTEPIIASFPNNMPSAQQLQRLQFNILQQESKTSLVSKQKRRLIKADFKNANGGVRYSAKNFGHDINTKDQASDYYLGVFSAEDNKVIMLPVTSCYQFTQEIEKFAEIYGGEEDNEAIKQMNYMSQKLQLANAFGTTQSKKKITSMLTNMIEDGGITNQANKGIRDHRLADKAHLIEKDQDALKHEILNASQRKQELYSVEKLLPGDLMDEIAYKNTFKALQNQDEELLKQYFLNHYAIDMVRDAHAQFDRIQSKSEKKMLLRACIYLDNLISFKKLPLHIEISEDECASKLKMQPVIFVKMRETFSQVSFKNQSLMNNERSDNSSANGQYQYVKDKEKSKILICHIIGIIAYLKHNIQFRAGKIAKFLKMPVSDLKSYLQELGLEYTPTKDKYGNDDLLISNSTKQYKEKKSGDKKKNQKGGEAQPNSHKNDNSIKAEQQNQQQNEQVGIKRTKRQQKRDDELSRLAGQFKDD
ncbi:UNKNOWN [Stylonychia lemnae]|uniref:Uncharacterized protein n=1 Tax=Stylonychia lemnae TaxID=5949 RepID=A0A077ZZS3_STYLE|nr:UNKNOWN [Stylonychia lemnae]|eukprot:CDW75122.1 UNKNOWN [Stylonychia lemnae]